MPLGRIRLRPSSRPDCTVLARPVLGSTRGPRSYRADLTSWPTSTWLTLEGGPRHDQRVGSRDARVVAAAQDRDRQRPSVHWHDSGTRTAKRQHGTRGRVVTDNV
jgi:hypothetical protein